MSCISQYKTFQLKDVNPEFFVVGSPKKGSYVKHQCMAPSHFTLTNYIGNAASGSYEPRWGNVVRNGVTRLRARILLMSLDEPNKGVWKIIPKEQLEKLEKGLKID